MITVQSFSYVPSTRSTVIRGVKNNRTPSNAISGGNGSFRGKGKDPEINLNIKEEDEEYTVNYYSFFKENLERKISRQSVTNVVCKVIGKDYQNEAELDSAIIANM